MPGMNGWQLVSRLRAGGQTAPILMFSANIGDAAATIGSDDSHNGLIAKPFDLRQLHDTLALHLGLKWIHESNGPEATPPPDREPTSPGLSHVRELKRLAEIGYVRGMEAKLADLAEIGENRPFTEPLTGYLKVFDLGGFLNFLKQFDDEKVEPLG